MIFWCTYNHFNRKKKKTATAYCEFIISTFLLFFVFCFFHLNTFFFLPSTLCALSHTSVFIVFDLRIFLSFLLWCAGCEKVMTAIEAQNKKWWRKFSKKKKKCKTKRRKMEKVWTRVYEKLTLIWFYINPKMYSKNIWNYEIIPNEWDINQSVSTQRILIVLQINC